jgi:hypothetical protein
MVLSEFLLYLLVYGGMKFMPSILHSSINEKLDKSNFIKGVSLEFYLNSEPWFTHCGLIDQTSWDVLV